MPIPAAAGARAARSSPRAGGLAWVAVGAIALAACLVRLRVAAAPLERDEGEYAYAGQLILAGVAPYAELYSMKLPGVYAAYAAILAVFGETATGVHRGLCAVHMVTIAAVFLLARRLFGTLSGVLAALVFAVLLVGQGMQGLFANAEHFVLLPACLGLWLLLRALESGRPGELAASGALLGLAFVVKQHGAAFAALGGLWLTGRLLRERPRAPRKIAARLALFAAACLAPLGLACALLAAAGALDDLWFWTVRYARDYVGLIPASLAFANLRDGAAPLVREAPALWVAAALGATALVWGGGPRGARLFAGAFAAASLAAVAPGFYFRQHYFLLCAPALALLAAQGCVALARAAAALARRPAAAGVLAAALALGASAESLVRLRVFLFELAPVDVTRLSFPYNPFAESIEAARAVAAHSAPDDRIAVLGSEPQIAFYARRRLATGFVYMYPLLEPHARAEEMQRRMVAELERADPEVVVFVTVPGSWLGQPHSRPVLRAWLDGLAGRYEQVTFVPVSMRGLPAVPDGDKLGLIVLRKLP